MPEVLPVPAEKVEKLWKDVRRIVQRRSARGLADYDYERLHGRLLLGRDMAWLAVQPTKERPLLGVILTSITYLPPSNRRIFREGIAPAALRSLTVHIAGGNYIDSWIESAAERISAYGQARGCRQLFILARKGWMEYARFFMGRGWDKVSYSRDRPTKHGGRKRRNRVGYYRVIDPPLEVRREYEAYKRYHQH